MCGIAGILSRALKSDPYEIMIRKMASLIHHRGPDDEGYYINHERGIYLGFKRLSIIDLSKNGHQPMKNEDETVVLVFNGEVYNFRELRSQLITLDHEFISRTDSEVVLHAYEEWGEDCVLRFHGMFAFAIWDLKENKLLLFRDRLGIKPLYYSNRNGWFAFASEVKSLLGVESDHEISTDMLNVYLRFPYIPDRERTLIDGINKLPPGHKLVINGSNLHISPYWEIEKRAEAQEIPYSFNACAEKLTSLLEESVSQRLIADVPLGIMLSGGLDSSYITCVANRLNASPVHTFTIGFNHQLDERPYASEVADHVGTVHQELMLSNERIFDRLSEFISVYDDLGSSDGGIISVFLMCEKIKELGIKVLLLGEGSDEIFGGYSWFGLSQYPFKIFPAYLRTWLYYHGFAKLSFQPGAHKAVLELGDMLSESKHEDIFKNISSYEIRRQLPNNFLMKVDKASMANSIEARVPFMDHKVVEFVYALKSQYKLRGNWFSQKTSNEKYILRKCAENYLPRNIFERKKQGFLLSITDMVKENIENIRDILLDHDSFVKPLFDKHSWDLLFKQKTVFFFEKQRLHMLWKLILLELWYKNVFARSAK